MNSDGIPGANPVAAVSDDGGDPDDVVKGTWIPDEDRILLDYVEKYGPKNWNSLRATGLLNRNGKSCRLRYMNQLKPGLLKNDPKQRKKGLSTQEENFVLALQPKFGNKWAKIASFLLGRTDNDVKNFWYLHKKQLAATERIAAAERTRTRSGFQGPSSSRQIARANSVRNSTPVMYICGTGDAGPPAQGSMAFPPQPDSMDLATQLTEDVHFDGPSAGQLFQKQSADIHNRERNVPSVVVKSSPEPFSSVAGNDDPESIIRSMFVRRQAPLLNVSPDSGIDYSHGERSSPEVLQSGNLNNLNTMFEIPSNLPSPRQYFSPAGHEDPFSNGGCGQVKNFQSNGGFYPPAALCKEISAAANSSVAADLNNCFNLKSLILEAAKQQHMIHKLATFAPATVSANELLVATPSQYSGLHQSTHMLSHVQLPPAENGWVEHFAAYGEISAPISLSQLDPFEATWGGKSSNGLY